MNLYLDVIRPTVAFSCPIPDDFEALASAAGLGQILYHPYQLSITVAGDMIPLLQSGLDQLLDASRRAEFQLLEPAEGWGPLEALTELVGRLLLACQDNPGAVIRITR